MRIVIATDTFLPNASGVVRACLNLGSALTSVGHDVVLLAPQPSFDRPASVAPFPVRYVPARVFRPLGRRPIVARSTAKRTVADLLAEFKPDIVHAHSPWAVGQAALHEASARRISTVLTVHLMRPNAVNHTALAGVAPELTWRIVCRAYRECGRHSDLLTSPTATGIAHVLSLFGERWIEVVSNGLTPLPRQPRVGREPGLMRLLYVGRLSKEKQVETLVRAVATRPLRNCVELKIVGSGTQTRSLKRLVRRLDAPASLEGSVSDVELAAHYAAADLFCMPSRAELECIAALEALSFGLPIVAPRGSALDDMHAWSGALSLYDDADSASDLARTIANLIAEPAHRATLQANAMATVKSRDLATVAMRWTQVYSRLRRKTSLASAPTLPASSTEALQRPVALVS
jgi:glycosyltransferase involved in cell wall biosynthesis